MKKILFLMTILTITNVFGADRAKSKTTNDLLTTLQTPSASTSPTNAFLVLSNRDNVDDHSVITTGMPITITPTSVVITRSDNLNLTNCSADNGVVSVTTTHITIATNTLPTRVLCSEANGVKRAFYTTLRP